MSTPRTGSSRFGRRRVGATAARCPSPFRIHFHVDANRDGVVDDDWTRNNDWHAGSRRRGAIILCNCDDENTKHTPDNQNNIIDTAADKPDIAPLHLRKHPPGCPPPTGWKCVIEVSAFHKDCIRIFDSQNAGATEIVGPTIGRSHEFTDLSPADWRLGMEATQFPGRMKRTGSPRGVGPFGDSWDGFVILTLKLLDAGGAVQYTETAKVRAAPWLIFNHHDPTEKVFVVDTGDNGPFRGDLTAAAGVPVQTFTNDDRWMQDVMEPGFTTLPQAGVADPHLPAILRTANDRNTMRWGTLDQIVSRELLLPNQGFYFALDPTTGTSLDSFGNLECVPPFRHARTGRDYKFGRIVYGRGGTREMREEIREFLDAQKVQFPFFIDTSWLVVGHVDEVLSFLPMDSATKKFKVLLASPRKALEILRRLLPTDPGALFFQGIRTGGTYGGLPADTPAVPSVANVLASPVLMAAQTYAQTQIDTIRTKLKVEIGIADRDFIEIPILFRQEAMSRCIAFTAGSVNMLVVTSGGRTRPSARTPKLCIPKPFGPVVGGTDQFQAEIDRVLAPTGAAYQFIDDFEDYHNGYGEIHCGTNSERRAPLDRFWWHQPRI